MLGAGDTLAVDAHVAVLAEAAALVEILVEAAGGSHECLANLLVGVVDLSVRAATAGAVNKVVPEGAHALLLGVRVDLVVITSDQDAGTVDQRVSGTAAAGVVLGVIGLVYWATLADVLDNDQAGLAFAHSVHQHLVGTACVSSLTPLEVLIVAVAGWADTADTVDTVVAVDAVAVERLQIEYLVLATLVAVVVRARGHLRGRVTVYAVLRVGCNREQQHEHERFVHHGPGLYKITI